VNSDKSDPSLFGPAPRRDRVGGDRANVLMSLVALVCVMALAVGSCKKTPAEPEPAVNSPMTLHLEGPEQVLYPNELVYSISCADEDGLEKLSVSFSVLDTQQEFTRYLNTNRFDTTLVIASPTLPSETIRAEARIDVMCYDRFEEQEVNVANATTTILRNTPTTFSSVVPSEIDVLAPATFVYVASDRQGIVSAVLDKVYPGSSDTSQVSLPVLGGDDFSYTLEALVSQPGTFFTRLSITDGLGEVTREEYRTQAVLTPTTFNSTIPDTIRVDEETTFVYAASDRQGIVSAVLDKVYPGSSDTSQVILPVLGGEDFLYEYKQTVTQAGTFVSRLTITDGYGDVEEQTYNTVVLANTQPRTITLDVQANKQANNEQTIVPANNIEVLVQTNESVWSGRTNEQGRFSFVHEARPTNNYEYQVRIEDNALQNKTTTFTTTQDTTITYLLQPEPITLSTGTIAQLYPRSSTEIPLSQLAQSHAPITIQLTYEGENLLLEQLPHAYRIQTSNADPAGVTEELHLQATHRFNTQTTQPTIHVQERRPITLAQEQLTVREQETLPLNLQELLQSHAPITRTTLAAADTTTLRIRTINQHEYTIQATQPGTHTIHVQAENRDGYELEQQLAIHAQELPMFSLTVVEHVHNQPVEQAYSVLERSDRSVLDSLVQTGGQFSIQLHPELYSVRLGQLHREEAYALEHRILTELVQENNHYTIPVANRRVYTTNKEWTGEEFTIDQMIRRWADMEITWANGAFGGGVRGTGGAHNNTLSRFDTENGQVNKIIVPKHVTRILYNFNTEETFTRQDSLSELTLRVIQDVYYNEIRPLVPELPELTIKEEYVWNAFDFEKNVAYIFADSRRNAPDGTIGFGGLRPEEGGTPGMYEIILITLMSNSYDDQGRLRDGTERGQKYAFREEAAAAFLERGMYPAVNLFPLESVVHNAVSITYQRIFPLNKFAAWATNNPLYHEAPNGRIYTNGAFIVPKEWNPDWDSVFTICNGNPTKSCPE
jgi:hypothetical protein